MGEFGLLIWRVGIGPQTIHGDDGLRDALTMRRTGRGTTAATARRACVIRLAIEAQKVRKMEES